MMKDLNQIAHIQWNYLGLRFCRSCIRLKFEDSKVQREKFKPFGLARSMTYEIASKDDISTYDTYESSDIRAT